MRLPLTALATMLILSSEPILGQEPSDGFWFTRAPMPTARQEVYPAVMQDQIFVIGGIVSVDSISAAVEVYDPGSNLWYDASWLPVPRHHYSTAVVGDSALYVFGGYITANYPWWTPTNITLLYDEDTDTWNEVAPMPTMRGEHNSVVFDGRVYIIGGRDIYGVDIGTVEVYDPATDSWETSSPMPTARHHMGAAVVDSLIYVAGGRWFNSGDWINLDAFEAYSPASNTWYTLTSLPSPRSALTATELDGKLYTFGGELPTIRPEVEVYDPENSLWYRLADMRIPRHGTHAVQVGDTTYVVAGAVQIYYGRTVINDGYVLGSCSDVDADGFGDPAVGGNTCPDDNCPLVYNPYQEDTDGDGLGDACDTCTDFDGDGFGDPGYPSDLCELDNCPDVYNPDQADSDANGIGDACCCGLHTAGLVGNANCSEDGQITLSDISRIIDQVYISKSPICCPANGNVNLSEDDKITLSDITLLIDAVYISKDPTSSCSD